MMNWKSFELAAVILTLAFGCASAQQPAPQAPAGAAAVAPTKEGVLKIGTGQLKSPVAIHTSPTGQLIVLDHRGGDSFTVVTYAPDGRTMSETPVPADVKQPRLAVADTAGNLYLMRERDTNFWTVHKDGTAIATDLKTPVAGITTAKVGGAEYLYVLGDAKSGVTRLHLPDMKSETIPLPDYPAGGLSDLRVRPDGHIYAFAQADSLLYHFDETGKFIEKIGGGGPHPPRVGVPAGYMGNAYDVAPNGDVYWSLGDYGALLTLSADGKTGTAYHGQEAEYLRWTGPLYTITGLALSGDHAYEIDDGMNRVTAFPTTFVSPGASQTDTIDARIFGYSYNLKAPVSYKLFSGDTASLRIAFDEGNRRIHNVALDYQVYDLGHHLVANGTQSLDVPGSAAADFPLTPVKMPLLGWYEMDTSLRTGDTVLIEQAHFFSRVQEDAREPIPVKEVSGWNDVATHKMIGLGLHRFGGSLQALLDSKGAVAEAEALGVPYFLALTDEKDCTPENVTKLLTQYPTAPILEIVNEPNLRMAVDKYVTILKTCYDAAKKVNPKVQIMGPTQCGTELNWFESFFKAGGGSSVDIVSVHTYERHNSMDVAHWNWKFNRLREIMAQYKCGDKPLYQTEHGYLGDYHGPILRHRWQARSLNLELMTLAQHGIGLNQYYYYYVNEGGFANFSSYLVNGDRELFPAAVINRTRTHFIGDKTFDHALNLGDPGNWLVVGSVFRGAQGDVVEMENCGAFRPVDVQMKLPLSARAFDSFGNPLPLERKGATASLAVGMYPSYITLPHGGSSVVSVPSFGRNIAPTAKISVTDAQGASDDAAMQGAGRLVNGHLEFDFESEPDRVGMRASDDKLPLDVTLDFGAVHKISSAILYSSLADNDKTAPLQYDVLVRTGGVWTKLDSITVPVEQRSLKIGGNVKRVTWY
ncbi:MAG: hypothetical protein M3Y56_06255, partial [Armatimonadota bacterium]|nr:hypothetical protein [Armatimonadota bacterium]